MNTRQVIRLCGILLAILALVFGCSFGVTVQGRVDSFLAALNNDDRTELYLNLDPNVANYEELKDTAYWGDAFSSGYFPIVSGGTPYSLANTFLDETTNPDVPVFTGDLYGPDAFSVTFKDLEISFMKVGMDWMIETIKLDLVYVVPWS